MAICPFAKWLPVKTNLVPISGSPSGLVLHISNDRRNSLEGLRATFENSNPFPSHFGITTSGAIGQFINTQYHDWAEEWSIKYFSVECCASPGDYLTYSQLGAVAQLYAWLHEEHKINIKLATSTSDTGLSYHSMGKTKHTHCPGNAVVSQREQIIELTNYIVTNKASPNF